RGIVVPLFPHLVAPLACFALIFPCRYLLEESRRKKIYRIFSYYMDNTVIDSLMNRDIETLLKGEYKDVTVLFLDIRDFTHFSGMHPAEEVVAFLNAFLGRINEVIISGNGMVNKYIGDGLLAFFWGEQSARDAVRVAERIVEEAAAMNADGTVPGGGSWTLRVGVGIELGRVLMGNIGSEKRMDFTIIGTPVNVASRLEGLNKLLNTRVLVGPVAAGAAPSEDLVSLGFHPVRGVQGEMEVFTPRVPARRAAVAGVAFKRRGE
ncbi:MAG TPA: adenylate/guanylate cyclase domain-containing protein, partial [Verrucomicrobiae bacterium]|nr:adenylate/guanylate cyclase domain-containing protein [Verrucomicrobiae bacterium]